MALFIGVLIAARLVRGPPAAIHPAWKKDYMHPMEMFELVIVILLAIIVLHYAANRLGLPPAVALLAGGALFAFASGASLES